MKKITQNILFLLKKRKKISFLIFLFVCFILIYFFVFYNIPSPTKLKNYQAVPASTQILDRNGKLLYNLYRNQKRSIVKIETLPKYVLQATIAIEDKNFYHHQASLWLVEFFVL